MKAIVFDRFGPPQVLAESVLPDPEPSANEVVVRVGAVGVGRLMDIGARAGKLPFARIEPPHVLGAEHAGVVAAVGPEVASVAIGDRVAVFPVITCGVCRHCRAGRQHVCADMQMIGIHRQGAYAEYCKVPAANATVIEDDVSDIDAAALAGSGPVAWAQLQAVDVREGDWVLIQAAGSALGSITAAVAQHMGARVIGTTRSAAKLEQLERLGLEAALVWTDEDFADRVLELTGGQGVEVTVDNIGDHAMFATSLAVLGRGGRVVTSGAFIGAAPRVDLRSLYTLSQSIVGVRTGNPASVARLWEGVRGGLRAVVDRSFPLTRAAEAHTYVERDENLGRVLLVPDQADE